MKQSKCHECWGLNGHHWTGCKTRGYSAVGPHPDAPARETDAPARDPNAAVEMCCGGTCVRALCFIHATEPRSTERAPAYEVEDLAPGAPTLRVSAAGPTVLIGTDAEWAEAGRRSLGWRLLGPDDPDVSTDLIYATPSGGVVARPQTPPRDAHLAQRQADAVQLDGERVAFVLGGCQIRMRDVGIIHTRFDDSAFELDADGMRRADMSRGQLTFELRADAPDGIKVRAMYLADKLATMPACLQLVSPGAYRTDKAWFVKASATGRVGAEASTIYVVRFCAAEVPT